MIKSSKNYSFEDSINYFAKATLLSNLTLNSSKEYKYNIAKNFNHKGVQYQIDPINVYTYNAHKSFNAYPVNYTGTPYLNYGGIQYFSLGKLNGDKSFIFNIPEGVNYEFVVRTNTEYKEARSQELQGKLLKLAN